MTEEQRIQRLESRVLVLTVIACLTLTSCVVMIVMRATTHAPPISKRLEAVDLRVGSTTLDGQTLHTKIPNAEAGQESEVMTSADDNAAFMVVGVGPVGAMASVDRGKPVVKLSATGAVRSIVEIDTDTGAWTLVRTKKSGPTHEQRTELIGPMTR